MRAFESPLRVFGEDAQELRGVVSSKAGTTKGCSGGDH